tara:strand:- start:4537 stop:4716 length:180 start_codon:yes stop_codon:yes gene_type:complete
MLYAGITKVKQDFEIWILSSIPDFDESLLLNFDKKDGYTESETVNAMWVGFCAAYKIYR